jgi:hypothetical protein
MKMHWCTGKVNLSGQNFTIIVYDESNPISWPEAQILMLLHGNDNVYEIKPCSVSDVSLIGEKERLAVKYGFKPVEQVFPGRNPRMETLMPGEPEDQQRADGYGVPLKANGNGNGEDDDEDDQPDDKPRGPAGVEEPPPEPPTAAVFKPTQHGRPAKGA